MKPSDKPSIKVRLTKSDVKGWKVTYGPQVLFVGSRWDAKRAASHAARIRGLRSWENEKARGVLVTIPL